MDAELEEVEFLALSPNRVAVLRLLSESAHTRDELAAETGASQATLGRILSDFKDRSWVERADGAYRATATGRLVSRGFDDLLAILETERELRDVVEYLPTEELDFDLKHLSDATVTLPTRTRPNAPLQRLVALEEEGESVRACSHAFNEQTLALTAERASAGEMDFQGVFSASAIDAVVEDPELREKLETILGAESASVRVREAEIPLAATIVDDTVHLLVRDRAGVLRAAIESTDPVVLAWAHETFETYWSEAEPLAEL